MHLHGLTQTVFAKDGWTLPAPYKADTVLVGPGERYDATFVADKAGIWAFHCHILTHAESANGMFGMVTAVVVQ
jgi:FtsP/CotA-like multicopper oxidase with cupredoxin domain